MLEVSQLIIEIRKTTHDLLLDIDSISIKDLNLEQRYWINQISNKGYLLSDQLSDFFDYVKVGSPNFQLEMRSFDLINLLGRSFEIVKSRNKDCSCEFKYQFDNRIPRNICGDPNRFEQAIINLLIIYLDILEPQTGKIQIEVSQLINAESITPNNFNHSQNLLEESSTIEQNISSIFMTVDRSQSNTGKKEDGSGYSRPAGSKYKLEKSSEIGIRRLEKSSEIGIRRSEKSSEIGIRRERKEIHCECLSPTRIDFLFTFSHSNIDQENIHRDPINLRSKIEDKQNKSIKFILVKRILYLMGASIEVLDYDSINHPDGIFFSFRIKIVPALRYYQTDLYDNIIIDVSEEEGKIHKLEKEENKLEMDGNKLEKEENKLEKEGNKLEMEGNKLEKEGKFNNENNQLLDNQRKEEEPKRSKRKSLISYLSSKYFSHKKENGEKDQKDSIIEDPEIKRDHLTISGRFKKSELSETEISSYHDKKKVRILIVDNKQLYQDEYRSMLKTLGYENVDSSYSGMDALEKIKNNFQRKIPYHIVFLDLKLPQIDGYTVAKEIDRRYLFGHSKTRNLDKRRSGYLSDFGTPIPFLIGITTVNDKSLPIMKKWSRYVNLILIKPINIQQIELAISKYYEV